MSTAKIITPCTRSRDGVLRDIHSGEQYNYTLEDVMWYDGDMPNKRGVTVSYRISDYSTDYAVAIRQAYNVSII